MTPLSTAVTDVDGVQEESGQFSKLHAHAQAGSTHRLQSRLSAQEEFFATSPCAVHTLDDAAVAEFRDATSNPSTPVAVAAIRALTLVIKLSTSSTVMGLTEDLQRAAAALKQVSRLMALLGCGSAG